MLDFFGMLRYTLLITFVVGFASCEKEESSAESDALAKRCAKALSKVGMDVYMQGNGKPAPEEQLIIDGVRKVAQVKCEAEGLSPEQAACFDAIVDIDTLFLSADCPAIAAKKPSWLSVPPREERKKVLNQRKQLRDEAKD